MKKAVLVFVAIGTIVALRALVRHGGKVREDIRHMASQCKQMARQCRQTAAQLQARGEASR